MSISANPAMNRWASRKPLEAQTVSFASQQSARLKVSCNSPLIPHLQIVPLVAPAVRAAIRRLAARAAVARLRIEPLAAAELDLPRERHALAGRLLQPPVIHVERRFFC